MKISRTTQSQNLSAKRKIHTDNRGRIIPAGASAAVVLPPYNMPVRPAPALQQRRVPERAAGHAQPAVKRTPQPKKIQNERCRARRRRRHRCIRQVFISAMVTFAGVLMLEVGLNNGLVPKEAVLGIAAAEKTHKTDTARPVSGKLQYEPVSLLYQDPELPNGCEITSLAMVLAAAGEPVNKVELYEDFLPRQDFSYSGPYRYGPDPEKAYAGNAASVRGGWYCFEKPIAEAAESWLAMRSSERTVQSLHGVTKKELDQYAKEEIPLVTWVTRSYERPYYSDFRWTTPGGSDYTPYANLHCVVLAGMENGKYRVADPIEGWQTVDTERFWQSFSEMGGRAVLIE